VKIQNTKIINEINDTNQQFESFNNFLLVLDIVWLYGILENYISFPLIFVLFNIKKMRDVSAVN